MNKWHGKNALEIFRVQNFVYLRLLSKNRVPNEVVLRALLFKDIPKGSWENLFQSGIIEIISVVVTRRHIIEEILQISLKFENPTYFINLFKQSEVTRVKYTSSF